MAFKRIRIKTPRRRSLLAAAAAAALSVYGCTPLSFGDDDISLRSEVDNARELIEGLENKAEAPAIARVPGHFVLNRPFGADFEWMEEETELVAEGLTLTDLLELVGEHLPVSSSIFINSQPIAVGFFEFEGSYGDLIRTIASRFGLDYETGPEQLTWRDELVRVFDVSHLAGSRSFSLSSGGSGSLGDGGGGGGGGNFGGGGNRGNFGSGGSGGGGNFGGGGGGGSASTSSDGDFWSDLAEILQTIVGQEGAVAISSSATLVTVRAPVPQMRQVEDFFVRLNRQLTVQVAIDVRLVQVTLSSEFSYGVNWSLLRSQTDGQNCIDGNAQCFATSSTGTDLSNLNEAPPSLSSGTRTSSANFRFSDRTNPLDSVGGILQLLQTQGSARVLTNPRAITLNNQPAHISIRTIQGYLQSRQITAGGLNAPTGSSDSQLVETQTPGEITTGFDMICLPKVTLDGDIILDISTSISSLLGLESIGDSSNSIQAPTINRSNFLHRALIASGETVVLGGIREISSDGRGGLIPFNKTSRRERTERILLITPYLI